MGYLRCPQAACGDSAHTDTRVRLLNSNACLKFSAWQWKLLSLGAVATYRYFTFYPHRVVATVSQKNLQVANLLLRKIKAKVGRRWKKAEVGRRASFCWSHLFHCLLVWCSICKINIKENSGILDNFHILLSLKVLEEEMIYHQLYFCFSINVSF